MKKLDIESDRGTSVSQGNIKIGWKVRQRELCIALWGNIDFISVDLDFSLRGLLIILAICRQMDGGILILFLLTLIFLLEDY